MATVCPACHFENIAGADRCAECLHSLMERDLPEHRPEDHIQNAMMNAPVLELLTGKDLLVASPNDSVSKVTKIFQKEQKNCLLVYDKKKLVGILSVRDLLQKIAGKIQEPGKVKISEIMTPHPEYVRADDSIAYAVNKMAMGGFLHLPVLREDGTPYSIIYIKDVLRYLTHSNPAQSA